MTQLIINASAKHIHKRTVAFASSVDYLFTLLRKHTHAHVCHTCTTHWATTGRARLCVREQNAWWRATESAAADGVKRGSRTWLMCGRTQRHLNLTIVAFNKLIRIRPCMYILYYAYYSYLSMRLPDSRTIGDSLCWCVFTTCARAISISQNIRSRRSLDTFYSRAANRRQHIMSWLWRYEKLHIIIHHIHTHAMCVLFFLHTVVAGN